MTSEYQERGPRLIEPVVLSRNQYEPGTYGHEHFPDILEGRLRPSDWADRTLPLGDTARDVATSYGVSSVADLMRLPNDTFDQYTRLKNNINKKLDSTLEEITARHALTPEGRLLGAIFGAAQGPVEPEDEPLLISAVNQTVQQLGVQGRKVDPRAQKILSLKFGLNNGTPMYLERVGQEFGITRERVRQIESRTLSILRKSDELKPFLTFPLQAVGREMGWSYLKDVPDVPGNMIDYASDSGIVNKYVLFPYSTTFKQALDIPLARIDADDRPAFLSSMRRILQGTKQHAIFGDVLDVASGPISQQATAGARSLPIDQLGFSAGINYELERSKLRTLGSLLTVNRDETGQITDYSWPVGQRVHERISKMGDILGAMLDSLQDQE